jgi:hypothetical protein
VSRYLWIVAVVTAVTRPVAWVLTFGILGPALGVVDYVVWDALRDTGGQRAAIVAMWAIPGVAVLAAFLIALAIRKGSAGSARLARWIALVFLIDIAVYLGGIVGMAVLVALVSSADVSFLGVLAVIGAVQLYPLYLMSHVWRPRPEVRSLPVGARIMGAWGYGPFEDDTAMDFVDGLREVDPAVVAQRLMRAVEDCADGKGTDDYTRAVEGCVAAALLAGYTDGAPESEELRRWLGGVKPDLTPDLADLALCAIEKAHDPEGDLAQLWEEGARLGERRAAMKSVERVLRDAVGPAWRSITR